MSIGESMQQQAEEFRNRYAAVIGTTVVVTVVVVAGILLAQFRTTHMAVTETSARILAESLRAQIGNQGDATARFLAESLVNPLFGYDLDAIDQLVESARNQPDVAYVYVADANGRLIHDGTTLGDTAQSDPAPVTSDPTTSTEIGTDLEGSPVDDGSADA